MFVNTAQACAVCGQAVKRGATIYCSVACYRVTQRSGSMVDRFWGKVNKTDGCWLWTASTISNGYGQFSRQAGPGQQQHCYAHRVSWEMANGPIPDGMSVLHRCDVPRCVNPAHLFLGTHRTNMEDAASKGRLSVPRPRRQKVTDEQVEHIIALARGGALRADVARQFGVSTVFVSLVVRGLRRQLRSAKKEQAA